MEARAAMCLILRTALGCTMSRPLSLKHFMALLCIDGCLGVRALSMSPVWALSATGWKTLKTTCLLLSCEALYEDLEITTCNALPTLLSSESCLNTCSEWLRDHRQSRAGTQDGAAHGLHARQRPHAEHCIVLRHFYLCAGLRRCRLQARLMLVTVGLCLWWSFSVPSAPCLRVF